MSDDESFVILGSSPMSSLENDGSENGDQRSLHSSLEADAPGSHFSSLKSSQLIALQSAQDIATQTVPKEKNLLLKSLLQNTDQNVTTKSKQNFDIQPEMAATVRKSKVNSNENGLDQNIKSLQLNDKPLIETAILQNTPKSLQKKSDENSGIKLWNRQPQVAEKENIMPISLEDCALKSPIMSQKSTDGNKQTKEPNSSGDKLKPTLDDKKITPPSSVESNLATSFIMGEVNADVLKSSVYSQFPSISVQASAEDVVKLQSMVSEYMELKNTIKKAQSTMMQFHNKSLEWKEGMQTMEEQYKKQLGSCQQEIELLRKQNLDLESTFKSQMEALEIARKKDREETIQEISEKNALLENLRVQIIKLEQQQQSSFEFVGQKHDEQQNGLFEKYYITRQEHEIKMKNIEHKLSKMLATNLDLKDVEKQYIDELNCLKVNLTAAEELINTNRAEIEQLHMLDAERKQQIKVLEKSIDELRVENAEQAERIALLEHQNDVHRKDFEMEQESRQTAVKEKQQILQDLRGLQRRNQELIEEHSKLARTFEKKLLASSANAFENGVEITAAAAHAQSYLNNPQRPVRVSTNLPSSDIPASAPPVSLHLCPVCNKAFKSLNILQSHVNDCIDKN